MGQTTEPEPAEVARIPQVRERAVVGKKTREGRTITVHSRPVSERVTVSESLLRETVSVERMPCNRVVEHPPPIREEGDLTVIPVVEERLVITRELVLKEEVHIRRVTTQETAEAAVDLTHTEITVDDS